MPFSLVVSFHQLFQFFPAKFPISISFPSCSFVFVVRMV